MRRWPLISLTAAAVAIGAGIGYLIQREADFELDESAPLATSPSPVPSATPLPVRPVPPSPKPTTTPKDAEVTSAALRPPSAKLETFLVDRQKLREQQAELLTNTYWPLLDALQLPGETRGALIELLTDQRMVGLETDLQSAVGSTSDFTTRVSEALAANQSFIEQLVGPQRAQLLKDYEVGMARVQMAQEALGELKGANLPVPASKAVTTALAAFDPGVRLSDRLASKTRVEPQAAQALVSEGAATMENLLKDPSLALTPAQRSTLVDWAKKRVQSQIDWTNAVLAPTPVANRPAN